MPFSVKRLAQLFRGKPGKQEQVSNLPAAEVDLPRALQAVIRFAETKQILDQVLHAQNERKLRSLAILSELPQEGRTLFSAVLAMGFGQLMRRKVLVVDCGTMRGSNSLTLERLLDFDENVDPNKRGELRKTLSLNVSLLRLNDWAEGRDAIAEYEVKNLLEGPGRNFDLVIFDTCAMGAKNRNNLDPIAIARRCDAALMVVSGKTSARAQLVKIRERMRKEKLELLGLASNDGVLA